MKIGEENKNKEKVTNHFCLDLSMPKEKEKEKTYL